MDWNKRGVRVNVQTDRQTDRNTVQALFKKMYGDSERQCKHSVTRHTYKLTDVQKHRASTVWTERERESERVRERAAMRRLANDYYSNEWTENE